MSKRKRELVQRIMDVYFEGHISKKEMYAMIDTISKRKEVVLYCRAADRGELAEQRSKLEKYAWELGYTIVGRYEDEGRSGADLDRPGLVRLLEAYADGEFDAVLVVDPGKLFRGPIENMPVWGFDILTAKG